MIEFILLTIYIFFWIYFIITFLTSKEELLKCLCIIILFVTSAFFARFNDIEKKIDKHCGQKQELKYEN